MTVANCASSTTWPRAVPAPQALAVLPAGAALRTSSGIPPSPSTGLTLSNSTLVGNQALGGAGENGVAGGVATGGGLDLSFIATATVSKTTFLGNSAQEGPEATEPAVVMVSAAASRWPVKVFLASQIRLRYV